MSGYDAIVLLGNRPTSFGTMTHILNERCNYCVKTYHAQKVPIVVSGGVTEKSCVSEAELMRDFLIRGGVEQGDIIMESNSMTTKQNAQFTAGLVKQRGYKKIAILSSPYHIHRNYLNPIKLFKRYVKDCEIEAVPDYKDYPSVRLMSGYCNERPTFIYVCDLKTIKNGKAKKSSRPLKRLLNRLRAFAEQNNVFIIDNAQKTIDEGIIAQLEEIYGCVNYEVRYE